MTELPPQTSEADTDADGRRSVLSNLFMASGLIAGYGAFAAIAGRFLYPAGPSAQSWQYVARVDDVAPGAAMKYRMPSGARVNIARRGSAGTAEDFVALSSTCPHLGCQVHWEGHRNRFFCPCHNGVFEPDGTATEGPPAEAGQRLSSYPLRVRSGLLYIQVPTQALAAAHDIDAADLDDDAPQGPGHDPCLSRRNPREL
ncbi:MAG: ubiquinol-cytochrome c reductase iron-sulfur subunit [Planctomycetota bacterium]